MKRSDRDREVSPVIKKIPFWGLRVTNVFVFSDRTVVGMRRRWQGSVFVSKESLATKLRIKTATERASGGSRRTFIEENRRRRWTTARMEPDIFCELRSLMTELSPFPQSFVEQEPATYRFALVVYHSRHPMFDSSTGRFQAVRLVIFTDSEWRLDSPIYERRVVTSGT